jgi:hypothetical protein
MITNEYLVLKSLYFSREYEKSFNWQLEKIDSLSHCIPLE